MTNVLILLRMPEPVRNQYLDGIRTAFPDLTVNLVDQHDKMAPYIGDTEVLITFGPMMSEDGLRDAAKLKWIQALGTGVDGLADQPSLKDHVILTNIRGIHGPPCSELTVMLMIALSRDFPRTLHNQDNAKWERWPNKLLDGKTVGLLGVGLIAEALAPILKAFNMETVGITETERPVPGIDRFRARSELIDVVGELDYLVVLVPHSDETTNLIDAEVLKAMKPSAFLINIARGGVLDEDALVDALAAEEIAGAALDVFIDEPLPPDHRLWKTDKVIVTPHMAGFNDRYAEQALEVIIENMKRFLAGETDNMINLVEQ